MTFIDAAIPQLIILYLTEMPSDHLPIMLQVYLHPILTFLHRMLVDVQPLDLVPYKGEIVIEVFDLHQTLMRQHDPRYILLEVFYAGFCRGR